MNQEQLEQGQILLKQIKEYKKYLDNWKNSKDYYCSIEIKCNENGMVDILNTPHIIPFNEYKERAIAYFETKINELQQEFDNL